MVSSFISCLVLVFNRLVILVFDQGIAANGDDSDLLQSLIHAFFDLHFSFDVWAISD
jgi:hypothetical protein